MDKPKNSEIQVKINSSDKEEFYQKCKEQAINPSAWLRKKIYEFIKEK